MTSYSTPTIFVPFHEVDDLVRIGTRALQPPAALTTPGTLYFVTDEGKIERSNGTIWEAYSAAGGGGGGAPAAHHATHEPGGTDPMAVDAVAATGSLRTLGTGAQQAAAGTDARLTNSRTPTAHHATHEPGGTDAMAVDAVAATGSLRTLGTGAQQATAGNDARLTNARTPTAHASTHAPAGSDPLPVPAITPWTPVDGSGAGLAITAATASNNYVKRDRQVQFSCHVQYPATANGAQAAIGGLPHACVGYNALSVGGQGSIASLQCFIPAGSKVIFFFVVGGGAYTNANLSNQAFLISGSYMTTE